MARRGEPFLSYLTVFRSRLGLLNLGLQLTSVSRQTERAISRRVTERLSEKTRMDLTPELLQYFAEKGYPGRKPHPAGRYPRLRLAKTAGTLAMFDDSGTQLQELNVFRTDAWMSDMSVRSTIGVPTADNARELIDFCVQLGLINRQRYSWNSDGWLATTLRAESRRDDAETDNPFVLLNEAPVFFRTLLDRDGPVLLELVCSLAKRDCVTRDELSRELPNIAERAITRCEELRWSRRDLRESRELVAGWKASLLREADRKPGQQRKAGPGVLEHRTSPRLEWLVDLGYLSKEGRARNRFEYVTTERLKAWASAIESKPAPGPDWALATVLREWREQPRCLRPEHLGETPAQSVARAYALVKRPFGPVPLRDIALVAGLGDADFAPDALGDVIACIGSWKGASIQGGRFSRAPETAHVPPDVLARYL